MSETNKPLSWWLKNLQAMPHDYWLWISKSEKTISPDTNCLSISGSVDLSDEEYEAKEVELKNKGLTCFFCKEQLKEIESNLSQQLSSYTQDQLMNAIDYYWNNDAFITIESV